MITIVLDDDHPNLCPVRAACKIFLQAKRLRQMDNEPTAVFINKSGKKKYLTGNKISDFMCLVARAVHPDLSKDKTNNSPHTQGEFGPLSCWRRPAWRQIS
jgi:hypothetical protein